MFYFRRDLWSAFYYMRRETIQAHPTFYRHLDFTGEAIRFSGESSNYYHRTESLSKTWCVYCNPCYLGHILFDRKKILIHGVNFVLSLRLKLPPTNNVTIFFLLYNLLQVAWNQILYSINASIVGLAQTRSDQVEKINIFSVQSFVKVPITPKYFFGLNKSLHLLETHCAFLPLFNPNVDLLQAVKVTKSGYHLSHDRASKGYGSIPCLTSQTSLHACLQISL